MFRPDGGNMSVETGERESTPIENYSQVKRLTLRASVSILFAVVIAGGLIIYPPLRQFTPINEWITARISIEGFVGYLAFAGAGLLLYVVQYNIKSEQSEEEEESSEEESEEVHVIAEAFGDIFEGLAMMFYITILLSIAALMGLATTQFISPALGAVVAVAYPIVDEHIGVEYRWYLSPASLLTMPTLLWAFAVSVIAAVISFTIGFALNVVGVSVQFLQDVWRTLFTSNALGAPYPQVNREGKVRRLP